ncbi:MAG: flavoprotein [Alphaproteobacteria bacterium]
MTSSENNLPRLAWAITGSGHFLPECLELMREFVQLDVFLSSAAEEVLRMYKLQLDLPEGVRVRRDRTASAAPVGSFYHGDYHTLVVAPATSNSVAKFVTGISDTLVTNVFAQAGKCRIPIIVYACDTGAEIESMAPGGMVKVFPRQIDLENVERLKQFSATTVVDSVEALSDTLRKRISCLNLSVSSS